jgi:hypothetical protein
VEVEFALAVTKEDHGWPANAELTEGQSRPR